jgi:L-methionine (R)-S-oxide reductase
MNWTSTQSEALIILETKGWDGIGSVCALLKDQVAHYQWVGIYWMNNAEQMLHLGPYAGAETEHTRIPYGRGICGQVALSGNSFEVPDVWAQDNYLACSMETKSELVVPIYCGTRLIGQVDIDSHYLNPFGAEDHALLEAIAAAISQLPEAAAIG